MQGDVLSSPLKANWCDRPSDTVLIYKQHYRERVSMFSVNLIFHSNLLLPTASNQNPYSSERSSSKIVFITVASN